MATPPATRPPTGYVPPPHPQATAQAAAPKPVSALWWLLPIFFGILGGVVAYIGVRDRDARKAKNMLIVSIVLTVVLTVLWVVLIFSMFSSLGR